MNAMTELMLLLTRDPGPAGAILTPEQAAEMERKGTGRVVRIPFAKKD